MVAFGCRRKIDAGTIGVISPSSEFFTACALRSSGTTTMISLERMICLTDMEIALVGTSVTLPNHPSFTCCCRQV